jgi:hypothetical protein
MNSTTSQRYSAYGLTIRSPIPLTAFIPNGAGEGDVEVRLCGDSEWVSALRDEAFCFSITRQEARFWIKNVGAFIVKGGSQVTVIPESGLGDSRLRLYIEGIMMANILYQRGMCVLHASVVEVHGSALAFPGPVGFGKSSIAAALYSRGHRVLTDDNAAIDFRDGIPLIRTAFPSLKLFPQIATSLGFRNGSLAPLDSSEVKVAGAVPNGFTADPLPLRGLYFLGRDYDQEIERLSPLKTAMELIQNSVPTRWKYPGDEQQLQTCGTLAKQIPAFALRTFTDLASLPILAQAVENHSMELAPS